MGAEELSRRGGRNQQEAGVTNGSLLFRMVV